MEQLGQILRRDRVRQLVKELLGMGLQGIG
jgi:hypothetical protein